MDFPITQLYKKHVLSSSWTVISILLVIILAGCDLIQITIVTKEPPPAQVVANPIDTATHAPPPTQVPTATESPTAGATIEMPAVEVLPYIQPEELSQTGPWFIYAANGGIFAADPEGIGAVYLGPQSINDLPDQEMDIPDGISPNGYMFAHRISMNGGSGYELEIIHFPSLDHEVITTLISRENLIQMDKDMMVNQNLSSAVIYSSNIAWSPDGRYLAFVAALDGPSSDLYVYDSKNKKVNHLTSGTLEVAIPYWTPDGKKIVYQVVESFGTGAGWAAKGVWVVNLDGSDNHKVYDNPDGSGPDVIVGMFGSKILVDHFNMHGDSLYMADIESNTLTMLLPDVTSAVMEPINGSYLALNTAGSLYFGLNPEDLPHTVSSKLFPYARIVWHAVPGRFIVLGESIAEVDQFGNLTVLDGVPYGGNDWASGCIVTTSIDCTSPLGSYYIPGFEDAVIYWRPDTFRFYFVSEGKLYFVHVVDRIPLLIDEDILVTSSILFNYHRDAVGWLVPPEFLISAGY